MKIDDLYKILELDITYDRDIIKRAYRKLTMKYSNNDNKIEELTNAYNTILNELSNIDNIKMSYVINNGLNNEIITNYNYKNSTNNPNNTNSTNIVNNDIIESNKYLYVKSDICIEQNITYEECYFGSNIPLEVNRYIYNDIIIEEKETIYIEIPIGIDDNEIILLKEKGNIYKDTNFDVKVRIKLIPHKLFTRKGLDLIYNKNITLLESLVGLSFILIHINKKKYMIKINEITIPNSNRIIDNMGFIRNNYTGKLIINYKVLYPKSLMKENIEILKKILI
tara:strand:+ start:16713 stop:17555 length:843 start_codon:yes stop_codon:yes gene_type:complete